MKIVIDGYNKSIHKKDNQIVIHEKGEILDSINASKINDITIVGKGYVTFDALNLMAENNIKMIAITPRGELTYTLESPDWRNVVLKKRQYQLSENKTGLKISLELIKSKIKNQKGVLKTLNKNKQLKRVASIRLRMDEYIKQLNDLNLNDKNIKLQIMGIEGKSSNDYWSSVKYFIPKDLAISSAFSLLITLSGLSILLPIKYKVRSDSLFEFSLTSFIHFETSAKDSSFVTSNNNKTLSAF